MYWMKQKEVMVVLDTQEEIKTISEEIRDILRKYEFRYATKQVKDEIKLDIETYFHRKFGYNNTPNNFEVIYNEDNCELSIVPSDEDTIMFWKKLGLL